MVLPLCGKQGVAGPLCVEGSGHCRNTGIKTADMYWAPCALNAYEIGTVFISILKKRKLRPEKRVPWMSQPMNDQWHWLEVSNPGQSLQVCARVAVWGVLTGFWRLPSRLAKPAPAPEGSGHMQTPSPPVSPADRIPRAFRGENSLDYFSREQFTSWATFSYGTPSWCFPALHWKGHYFNSES